MANGVNLPMTRDRPEFESDLTQHSLMFFNFLMSLSLVKHYKYKVRVTFKKKKKERSMVMV